MLLTLNLMQMTEKDKLYKQALLDSWQKIKKELKNQQKGHDKDAHESGYKKLFQVEVKPEKQRQLERGLDNYTPRSNY